MQDSLREAVASPRGLAPSEAQVLGAKLRRRRKVRREGLQTVADAAGISIGQLSQIERGLSQPSLKSLRTICQALDMPIGWLFDDDHADRHDDGDVVVRRNKRREFALGPGGVVKQLMSTDACRTIQLLSVTIPPGGHSGGLPFATGSAARSGVVISGSLGIEVDGERFILEAGDAFTFENRNRCRFWCEGEASCDVVWAVSPAIY